MPTAGLSSQAAVIAWTNQSERLYQMDTHRHTGVPSQTVAWSGRSQWWLWSLPCPSCCLSLTSLHLFHLPVSPGGRCCRPLAGRFLCESARERRRQGIVKMDNKHLYSLPASTWSFLKIFVWDWSVCVCTHTLFVTVLMLVEWLRVQNSGQNQGGVIPNLEDKKGLRSASVHCLTVPFSIVFFKFQRGDWESV